MAMSVRPPAPGPGFVVRPDPDWTTDHPSIRRRCRWTHQGVRCEQQADAVLMRPAWAAPGRLRRPWAYCRDHLYGRWIEDGRVMQWYSR